MRYQELWTVFMIIILILTYTPIAIVRQKLEEFRKFTSSVSLLIGVIELTPFRFIQILINVLRIRGHTKFGARAP